MTEAGYLVMRNDMQQTGLNPMITRAPRAPTDKPPKKRAPRQIPTDTIPPDNLPAIFARNLKIARLQHSMTLEDVANVIGMTQQAVSKIETGKSGFTLTTMKKLADVFGLEVRDMLKLSAAEPATDDNLAPHPSRKKNT